MYDRLHLVHNTLRKTGRDYKVAFPRWQWPRRSRHRIAELLPLPKPLMCGTDSTVLLQCVTGVTDGTKRVRSSVIYDLRVRYVCVRSRRIRACNACRGNPFSLGSLRPTCKRSGGYKGSVRSFQCSKRSGSLSSLCRGREMSAFERILTNSRKKSSATPVILSPNSKHKERFDMLNGRHSKATQRKRGSAAWWRYFKPELISDEETGKATDVV